MRAMRLLSLETLDCSCGGGGDAACGGACIMLYGSWVLHVDYDCKQLNDLVAKHVVKHATCQHVNTCEQNEKFGGTLYLSATPGSKFCT
jgi:hypothetical protein